MISGLPKEFSFAHDYCTYLLDSLSHLVEYGEEAGAFEAEFEVQDPAHLRAVRDDDVQAVFERLEKHGYHEVLGDILIRATYPALLNDMCEFVGEALRCSEEGKLCVAYALLRKPLCENLMYLEWLLADAGDMLTRFYNGPPQALVDGNLVSRDKAVERTKLALEGLLVPEAHDPEFLYQLRYDKSAEFGLQEMLHKAMHLVTTRLKEKSTERMNFNFIFSGEEEQWLQWYYLYSRLPVLLNYAVDVCEALLCHLLPEPMSDIHIAMFRRLFGLFAWNLEFEELDNDDDELRDYLQFLDDMPLPRPCPECGSSVRGSGALFRGLFYDQRGTCPNCDALVCLEQLIHNH